MQPTVEMPTRAYQEDGTLDMNIKFIHFLFPILLFITFLFIFSFTLPQFVLAPLLQMHYL